MLVRDAVDLILEQFKHYEKSYTRNGVNSLVWVIENNTDFDFSFLKIHVLQYDAEDVIIDETTICFRNFERGMKVKEYCRFYLETKNVKFVHRDDDWREVYPPKDTSREAKILYIKNMLEIGLINQQEYENIEDLLLNRKRLIDISCITNTSVEDEYFFEGGFIDNDTY